MWKCKNCKERIEDEFFRCWKCGTSKDGSPPTNPDDYKHNRVTKKTKRKTKGNVIKIFFIYILNVVNRIKKFWNMIPIKKILLFFMIAFLLLVLLLVIDCLNINKNNHYVINGIYISCDEDSYVNMRAEPHPDSSSLMKLDNRTIAQVIGSNNNKYTLNGHTDKWYKIKTDNKEGWCFGYYIIDKNIVDNLGTLEVAFAREKISYERIKEIIHYVKRKKYLEENQDLFDKLSPFLVFNDYNGKPLQLYEKLRYYKGQQPNCWLKKIFYKKKEINWDHFRMIMTNYPKSKIYPNVIASFMPQYLMEKDGMKGKSPYYHPEYLEKVYDELAVNYKYIHNFHYLYNSSHVNTVMTNYFNLKYHKNLLPVLFFNIYSHLEYNKHKPYRIKKLLYKCIKRFSYDDNLKIIFYHLLLKEIARMDGFKGYEKENIEWIRISKILLQEKNFKGSVPGCFFETHPDIYYSLYTKATNNDLKYKYALKLFNYPFASYGKPQSCDVNYYIVHIMRGFLKKEDVKNKLIFINKSLESNVTFNQECLLKYCKIVLLRAMNKNIEANNLYSSIKQYKLIKWIDDTIHGRNEM